LAIDTPDQLFHVILPGRNYNSETAAMPERFFQQEKGLFIGPALMVDL
jgi:hypothetical protein